MSVLILDNYIRQDPGPAKILHLSVWWETGHFHKRLRDGQYFPFILTKTKSLPEYLSLNLFRILIASPCNCAYIYNQLFCYESIMADQFAYQVPGPAPYPSWTNGHVPIISIYMFCGYSVPANNWQSDADWQMTSDNLFYDKVLSNYWPIVPAHNNMCPGQLNLILHIGWWKLKLS